MTDDPLPLPEPGTLATQWYKQAIKNRDYARKLEHALQDILLLRHKYDDYEQTLDAIDNRALEALEEEP